MTKQTTTLTGYITPTGWARGNHVTAISLLTSDQEEIHIDLREKNDRLLSLVWEKVELTGRLRTNRKGEKNITVDHYRPVDDFALIQEANAEEDDQDVTEEIKEVVSGAPWISGQDLDALK